jgi:hypothetical protein
LLAMMSVAPSRLSTFILYISYAHAVNFGSSWWTLMTSVAHDFLHTCKTLWRQTHAWQPPTPSYPIIATHFVRTFFPYAVSGGRSFVAPSNQRHAKAYDAMTQDKSRRTGCDCRTAKQSGPCTFGCADAYSDGPTRFETRV